MAVVRVNKTSDFTVMSNTHFKEREMSLKAKGLLSLMLSLPDEWDYSVRGLVTLSKDGKGSVTKALIELEELGYVKRTRAHDEKGRFSGYDYDIFETPYAEKPLTENPSTENPMTGKPLTENPPQLNTNILTPKELKNNVLSTDEEKATPDYDNENDILKPIKGNLMLSENQISDLLDKMGLEAFDEYLLRLSEYVKKTGFIIKSHYETMLKWYNEDRQIAN